MAIVMIRVTDFETTGTEPPAEVVESGFCDLFRREGEWRVGLPVSCLHGVEKLTAETRAIHHIAPSDIVGCHAFDAKRFVDQSHADHGERIFAAHHADFERKWLGPALGTLPLVCTYKAALRVWPDLPHHGNQYLRYKLEEDGVTEGVDAVLAQPAHRAGPDAYATAHLLRAILKHASIEDLITWTGEPALLPRITIGKQKGARWSEVEAGFLNWMLQQPTMDPDLKWNARRELDRRAGR